VASQGVRVCHFHGTPFSYNAAISFLETGKLIRFHTSIYAPAGIRRRFNPELPKACVSTHPLWESMRLAATSLPLKKWGGQQQWFVDLVCRKFDKTSAAVLQKSDGAVYCYEDSASLTFERAKDLGVRRIYELPILHYREMQRVYQPEVDRFPELSRFFQSFREPQWKLEQKDKELAEAEVIVVPATFVRQSIERFHTLKGRFVVAPYGADTSSEVKRWTKADEDGPLRLIFVGGIGPRKGVHLLFEAISKLRPGACHLTLVGRWDLGYREWLMARYPISYEWAGPLSKDEVHAAYRRAHALVFPSLAEGFALVISEAMASGIPVITTERTGGLNIIDEGKDGWIVKAGDPEALRSRIEHLLDNRDTLADVGKAARRKVEFFSWQRYRRTLRDGVAEALCE
jgi:glycosyltransferase involved in cell wall biosynthesis